MDGSLGGVRTEVVPSIGLIVSIVDVSAPQDSPTTTVMVSIYYSPQTKFAKVMFLHVSVILSIWVGSPGPYPGGR